MSDNRKTDDATSIDAVFRAPKRARTTRTPLLSTAVLLSVGAVLWWSSGGAKSVAPNYEVEASVNEDTSAPQPQPSIASTTAQKQSTLKPREEYYRQELSKALELLANDRKREAAVAFLRISGEGSKDSVDSEIIGEADYQFSQLVLDPVARLGLDVSDHTKVSLEALWSAAFRHDHPEAQYWLAKLILRDDITLKAKMRGFPHSKQQAITFLTHSAASGNEDAKLLIARFTREGIHGFLQNANDAHELEQSVFATRMEKANNGDDNAALELVNMYETGLGTRQDPSEAIRILETLAERGNQTAISRLVARYTGSGSTPKDWDRAFFWQYTSALKTNDPKEVLALGELISKGLGFPGNPMIAHALFNFAASGNKPAYRAAELRNRIEPLLNPSQLVEAQDVAKNCQKSGLKHCLLELGINPLR